jgi:DNA-3-methyladenine glycosylase II
MTFSLLQPKPATIGDRSLCDDAQPTLPCAAITDQPLTREIAPRVLAGADSDPARLVSALNTDGLPFWTAVTQVTRGDPFGELVLHIIGEDLVDDAALRLFTRLRETLDAIEPMAIALASLSDLRAVGLPGARARTLQHVAGRALDVRLSMARLATLNDQSAEIELVRVHGIAPWAAQMLLLHHFRRADVWPAEDPALREAARLAFGLPVRPTPAWLAARASAWRPYRSYAAAALWSAADLHPYQGA